MKVWKALKENSDEGRIFWFPLSCREDVPAPGLGERPWGRREEAARVCLFLSPALCRTLGTSGQPLLLSSLCSFHSLTLTSVFERAVAVWILLLLFLPKKEARYF